MFDSPFSISSILGLPSKSSSDVPMTTAQHLARSTQPDKHSYKIPYNEYGSTSSKPLIQPSKKKVLTTSSSSSSSSSTRKMTTADDKKTKRFRSSFSTEQLRTMEDTFRHRPYLSTAQVEELAGNLALSSRQVKIWFQNRRTKLKKQVTPVSMNNPAGMPKYPNATISQYLYYIQNSNTNIMNTLNRYNDRRY
uniref:ANTP class homeobox transcription factor ANTP51 n=1 Tax=Mnemiopsis leidyi TaxID=27923 RepID=E3UJX9_MNELE|nr:ANTP class homeobox transcription factor ANTP51 [Mnemiopsis leidyi]